MSEQKEEKKQTLTITVDKQLLEKLRKEAEQKERSISYIVNDYIKKQLK